MNFFEKRIQERGGSTLSVGGKIRAGTKAMSRKASENTVAAKIYQQVLEGRMSFKDAEKEISQKTGIRNPFFPRNTREFHVHPWDMGIGGAATSRKILDLYGEDDGSGQRKLYRFPIVFPEVGPDVSAIIEGGLRVQGGGQNTPRYWSAFNEAGQQECRFLPPVQQSEMAQRRAGRPIRRPERKPLVRGLCNPEACAEFASGACRFVGKFRFYIPGIAGAGLFELSTGSTQAATDIYQRLTQALRATGGRAPNFTKDGRPVLWLTKERKTRAYFDEDGNEKTSEQWIPALDMEIEMPKVIMLQSMSLGYQPPGEPSEAVLAPTRELDVPQLWQQQAPAPQDVFVVEPQEVAQPVRSEVVKTPVQDVMTPAPAPAPAPKPQTDAAPAPAAEPVLADPSAEMLSHAASEGYEAELQSWIQARFEGQFVAAYPSWKSMTRRFGARIKEHLKVTQLLHDQNINGDLAARYLRLKFGPMGSGARLAEMLSHLQEMCSDGASVATSVMEEELGAVAQ